MASEATEAVLAVTSTIVHFIECASRLASHGLAIYSNAGKDVTNDGIPNAGESKVEVDIAKFKAELKGLEQELVGQNAVVVPARLDTVDTDALATIQRACGVVAGDLVLRMDLIATTQNEAGSNSIAGIWLKEDVDGLGARLWELRTVLELLVMKFLRESSLVMDHVQAQHHEYNDPYLLHIVEALQKKQEVLVDEIKKLQGAKPVTQNVSLNVPEHVGDATPSGTATPVKNNLGSLTLHDPDPNILASDKASILQEFILDGLSYKTMRDREEDVAEAHSKTFEWIFDESANPKDHLQSNFLPWLTGDDLGGIYWIQGKAGSGKSTLMRFIYEHNKTQRKLKQWAVDKPLTVASHFFWTSGSLEQRSQSGLLRYLLFQLLDQHRDLIPIVFPDLWQKCWTAKTQDRIKITMSWDIRELMHGLRLFLHQISSTTRVCLFIDGLDEFEGDHDGLIGLIHDIIESADGNIKMCVSSRPWEVFERAFESIPSLKLQDLTISDMRAYVSDRLTTDKRFTRLLESNSTPREMIIDHFVLKADGVFLWVILGVRFLLLELDGLNDYAELQQKLHQLPGDLTDLFRYTLIDIQDPLAVVQATQLFKLIQAKEVAYSQVRNEAASSVTLWELALAFTSNDEADFDLLVNGEVQDPDDDQVLRRCESMRDIISLVCGGLLQINKPPRGAEGRGVAFHTDGSAGPGQDLAERRVTFLHRTVRDYLIHEGGLDFILQHALATGLFTDFDPHRQHLGAYLLQLKLPFVEIERSRRLDDWWLATQLAMTHARNMEPLSNWDEESESPYDMQTTLLKELDRVISRYYWAPKKKIRRPFGGLPPQNHLLPPEVQAKLQATLAPDSDHSDPDTWARAAFYTFEQRSKTEFHDAFLSLCVKFGLETYVSDVLTYDKPQYISGQPILVYAIEFLLSRKLSVYPLSSPRLVQIILDCGADPNQPYKDFAGRHETPWLRVLKNVRQGNRLDWIERYDCGEDGTKRWTQIMNLFLDKGADVNTVIDKNKWDPSIAALEVVREVKTKFASRNVEKLEVRMMDMGALALAEM